MRAGGAASLCTFTVTAFTLLLIPVLPCGAPASAASCWRCCIRTRMAAAAAARLPIAGTACPAHAWWRYGRRSTQSEAAAGVEQGAAGWVRQRPTSSRLQLAVGGRARQVQHPCHTLGHVCWLHCVLSEGFRWNSHSRRPRQGPGCCGAPTAATRSCRKAPPAGQLHAARPAGGLLSRSERLHGTLSLVSDLPCTAD